MFDLGEKAGEPVTEWLLKERIKNYLLEQGASKENVVVLIIDEGQKIPGFCLEILREFLNYETSEHKLLQIVIFAQNEFRKTLEERSNFTDRINFLYDLGPLNFGDTRSMIRYRMRKASKTGENPLHFYISGHVVHIQGHGWLSAKNSNSLPSDHSCGYCSKQDQGKPVPGQGQCSQGRFQQKEIHIVGKKQQYFPACLFSWLLSA